MKKYSQLLQTNFYISGPMTERVNLNFFLANGKFYSLLTTFANILDPDQDQQNVGSGMDSNRLTL